MINLLDILTPQSIRVPLQSATKRGVIDELVDVLASAGKVQDSSALKDAVWAREQARTTGVGHGLAIPHGKCAGMAGLAMAIGRPGTPMEFDAIDQRPVRLIVLLASPPDRTSDHIQALARVTRLMMMEDFREQIYSADSAERIYDILRSKEQA